jgi:hypothetical protein
LAVVRGFPAGKPRTPASVKTLTGRERNPPYKAIGRL